MVEGQCSRSSNFKIWPSSFLQSLKLPSEGKIRQGEVACITTHLFWLHFFIWPHQAAREVGKCHFHIGQPCYQLKFKEVYYWKERREIGYWGIISIFGGGLNSNSGSHITEAIEFMGNKMAMNQWIGAETYCYCRDISKLITYLSSFGLTNKILHAVTILKLG